MQTITITNEPPVLNCDNLDQTIACTDARGENDLPRPTVTDDCSDANEITLTFVDDESGLDDCGDAGVIQRTWTATDACGLTATCVQIITINNEAPTLVCDNLDTTIGCDEPRGENDLPRPTVTDDCDNDVQVTFTETTNELDCAGKFNILRKWVATDNCGNRSIALSMAFSFPSSLTAVSGLPVVDTVIRTSTISLAYRGSEKKININKIVRIVISFFITPKISHRNLMTMNWAGENRENKMKKEETKR